MRLALAFVAVTAIVGAAARAWAYPFLSPRPIPDAIAGPTDPHPAAAFYNPAALGYLRGLHLFLDGAARADLGSINRDGTSNGSTAIAWANLDTFAGLTWDLGTDSFDLGLAVYTPFTELSSYPARSPVRYQEQYQHFASLEETFAAAWKIENHISVGAGLIIDENFIDYGYARDLAPAGGSALVSQPNSICGGACGYENPAAQQNLKLRGYATGIGFTVGVVAKPVDRLWIGVSYTSHQTGGDLFLTSATNARVQAAPGQGGFIAGGNDRVVMLLPEMIQAGVRIQATPTLDIEAQWRFIHYGARHELDVSLQGGGIAATGVAPQYLLDRGLQNSYMIEVSTRHRVTDALRLSPSLAFETSAIAADAVSAAALDANKLDAALTMEWRVWRSGLHSLQVGGHVGVTGYFLGHVSSRYSAQAETACVDAQYSLSACTQLDTGSALPSSSGDYTLVVVHAGAAIGFNY